MHFGLSARKSVVLATLAASLGGVSAAVAAPSGFTDTFDSLSDAGNYTPIHLFGDNSRALVTGLGTATLSSGGTTFYLRNTGESLNPGDSVTLKMNDRETRYKGLGFTNTFTEGESGLIAFALFAFNGGINPDATLAPTGASFGIYYSPTVANPLVFTVTRGTGANANIYTYSASGAGIVTPLTGTSNPIGSLTETIYFGLGEYNGTDTFNELTYTPAAVPEPTSAVLVLGAAAIGLVRRRRD